MNRFVVRRGEHILTVECRGADTWAVSIGVFPESPVVFLYREDARRLRDLLDMTIRQADRNYGLLSDERVARTLEAHRKATERTGR